MGVILATTIIVFFFACVIVIVTCCLWWCVICYANHYFLSLVDYCMVAANKVINDIHIYIDICDVTIFGVLSVCCIKKFQLIINTVNNWSTTEKVFVWFKRKSKSHPCYIKLVISLFPLIHIIIGLLRRQNSESREKEELPNTHHTSLLKTQVSDLPKLDGPQIKISMFWQSWWYNGSRLVGTNNWTLCWLAR